VDYLFKRPYFSYIILCLGCWITGLGTDRQYSTLLCICLCLGHACQRDSVAFEHRPVGCTIAEVSSESTLNTLAFGGETFTRLIEEMAYFNQDFVDKNQVCNHVSLSSF